ncbi:Dam family site-specific DNA-(adenine-N6)-methyltransferase [Cedecea davisae]|uniref:Dam family site-specific DNA-(Adenine-N6)-methyltransferase n=1 Tax=Cedecea davisae TaxID=158484 RepID=A0ABS6DJ84_9ENTR|nr:Dam family site-specific DNA-(adenine-N6)-methyltransferase [Cedecea davisae]MBU4686752.1 Dam family site-specific DNA-(adenine-N6)-methyltransferase [Cedecea davisae]
MPVRYGSVCSGIEAASVAWEPLGWQPAWFSEIEAFPSAVLAQRWPEVANLGDMTKIAAAVRAGEVEAPDAVVGGTPCQAFSVAGLRNGLSDARGQLTLSYVELADAIDDKRRESGEEETIFVWENVPGVLSSKDNAFGCFIGALAGESCELQPAGGKWPNAGCVYGPSRIVAWRVLDAQFFGVAQRRRRVFVVASAREGFDPAAVLFELESVRRDSAPRRETQKAVAALTARGVGTCGADDNQAQAGHLIAFGGGNTAGHIDVATACTAHGIRLDFDTETFAVHGTQDPDTNRELAHTLGRNNGQENACIAFSYKDNGADATSNLSPTIRAGNHDKSHANSGQPPAIAYEFKAGQGAKAGGIGYQEEQSPTLTSASSGTNLAPAVIQSLAVRRLTPRECERLQGFPDDHTLIEYGRKVSPEKMDRDFAKYLMRGGKLTFEECCGRAADGPRYKAIGNSMAVPVMRWIGERIAEAVKVSEPTAPARTWQRPFLKWAGGKFSLLGELDKHIPAGQRLIEPFVGGGSVFLNSDKHAQFLLADVNADLINLYRMLAAAPDDVIAAARHMFELLNSADDFDAIKAEFNGQCLDAVERAAALLYLNRHCFNGLIRYNQRHEFNVGYGKYKSPYFPESEISAFASMAHNCVFLNADFNRTLALAGAGDVVYCDPPYEPLPGTDGFTGYSAGGFKWEHQVALVECCAAAHQRGAQIVISNSTAPKIIELYEQHGFELHYVAGCRAISCNGGREAARDLIATLKVKP